jgi:TatA/E family protein of Tat protein translocase
VGVPELLIVVVISVLISGAGKLPEISKVPGKGTRQFREGTQGLIEEDSSALSSSESGEA